MSGPKRIFAWPWEVNPQMGQWTADQQIVGEGAEYVHIDEVQALIAGAFEAAARETASWFHKGEYDMFSEPIRALTPAHAVAARDAMIAEARAQAFANGRTAERLACSAICDGLALEISCHLMPTSAVNALRSAADAIRKRGEGQP